MQHHCYETTNGEPLTLFSFFFRRKNRIPGLFFLFSLPRCFNEYRTPFSIPPPLANEVYSSSTYTVSKQNCAFL